MQFNTPPEIRSDKEWRKKGREGGKKEGREEGGKEGREEEREEGRKEGRELGRKGGREEGRKGGLHILLFGKVFQANFPRAFLWPTLWPSKTTPRTVLQENNPKTEGKSPSET
jgi:hypothetical protein